MTTFRLNHDAGNAKFFLDFDSLPFLCIIKLISPSIEITAKNPLFLGLLLFPCYIINGNLVNSRKCFTNLLHREKFRGQISCIAIEI